MLQLLKRFLSLKEMKKQNAQDVSLSVKGDLNLSITNVYHASESNEVYTNTSVSTSTALRKARKLDDCLLELTLNYIINEKAIGVKIYRVQEENSIHAYLFTINNRVYAYIDTMLSQLQPGVRTGGVIKTNIQFAIITSHTADFVVENPSSILTGLKSNESIVLLEEEEIVHAKKILLVG